MLGEGPDGHVPPVSPTRRVSELERPQPSPGWGRFLVSFWEHRRLATCKSYRPWHQAAFRGTGIFPNGLSRLMLGYPPPWQSRWQTITTPGMIPTANRWPARSREPTSEVREPCRNEVPKHPRGIAPYVRQRSRRSLRSGTRSADQRAKGPDRYPVVIRFSRTNWP